MITIKGQPPSKSNSYRIGHKTLYKTKKLKDYEQDFMWQLKQQVKIKEISTKFILEIKYYFKTAASDLDGGNKATLDILQAVGLIKNDNLCYKIIQEKFIDKANPRIEFTLLEYKT